MKTFHLEAGMILGRQQEILHRITGSPGSVEFPADLILQLHRLAPGSVTCLTHMHPPYMSEPSPRDILTVQTLAKALHPFPLSLQVVAETLAKEDQLTKIPYTLFSITTISAQLESQHAWEERGKTSPRELTIAPALRSEIVFFPNEPRQEYWDSLIRMSYTFL